MEREYMFNLIEKSDVVIKAYNFIRHPAGYSVNIIIPDFDVLYTISGRYHLTINEKHYVSTANDVFILPPNTLLTLKCTEVSSQIYCHFTQTVTNITDLGGDFKEYLIPAYFSGLTNLYKRQFELCMEQKLPLFSSVSLIFKLFLIEMLHTYSENFITLTSGSQGAVPADILKTLNYIHANLNQNIASDVLAEIAGFNTSYFCRHFKKYMGVSPIKYINNHKMNFAKYFISTTNKSMQEIASLLGFTDQFTFSKKFKEYYKVSPSEFRKINI